MFTAVLDSWSNPLTQNSCFLIWGVLEILYSQVQAIAIALGSLLDGQTLWLKIPYTLVLRHREINLVLTRGFLLASFILPRGLIKDSGRRNLTRSLTVNPVIYSNSGTNIMGVTNCFLIGFEMWFTGGNTCLAV